MTATGSFLLFAAAVTLVAVRWDQIPDGVKLGALALVSGGLLVAGRPGSALADRHAPAAANVLFHLGAFLAPVTASAVLIHLEVPRDQQLVALGAASTALFWVLGRQERSVVLEWATLGATVATAVGLGGLAPVPATAWLVGLAAGAFVLRFDREAVAWATLATVAPLGALVGAVSQGWLFDAVVGEGLTPGIVGLAAAVVLVGLTHRLQSLPLLAVAATALISGLATTAAQLDPDAATYWVAAGAAFALLELAAVLLRRDPFWHRPLDATGTAAEVVAFVAVPWTALVAIFLPVVVDDLDDLRFIGLSLALAAVGWFLADLRRQEPSDGAPALHLLVGGGYWPGTTSAVVSAVTATGFLTTSLPVTAAVAGVLAVLLVVSGRAGSTVLVTGLVVTAMALVAEWPAAAAAVGCAGAVLVAFQATLHRQEVAWNLALLSLVPAAGALAALEGVVSEPTAIVGGLLLAAVLAWELDQARCGDALGWVPRVAGTVLLLPLADHGAADITMVTAVYVALATFEGFRRDDRTPLFGWAIGLPPLVGSVAVLAGLEPVESAVVLAAAAFPVAAAGHLRAELRLPLMATASSLAVCGIAVGAAEPGVLGTVLLLDGLVALGLGLATREVALLAGGGTAAVIGTWIHLNLGEVEAIDLYALPVAVLLWLVASRVADDSVSSWVTHAPAIALAGGAAMAERIGGGGGAHALLAGAIGVLAVVEGGGRRLAAPLLLGTGLLIALTANETAVVTAGVPTWAWLAAGGTLLVAAGLVMEHHELGPVETGRRLVDVVQDRFQ